MFSVASLAGREDAGMLSGGKGHKNISKTIIN